MRRAPAESPPTGVTLIRNANSSPRSSVTSRRWLSIAVVSGCALLPSGGQAQLSCDATNPAAAPTCSVSLTATASVATLMRLSTNVSTVAITTPTIADYDLTAANPGNNGLPGPYAGPTVTVKSNRPWTLSVKAQSAFWSLTPSGPVRPDAGKPAGDLLWSLNSAAGFAPLTTSDVTMGSAATGSTTTFNVHHRVKWFYTADVPGDYALTVVYTLTAN